MDMCCSFINLGKNFFEYFLEGGKKIDDCEKTNCWPDGKPLIVENLDMEQRFSAIPIELVLKISSYLSGESVLKLNLTCKKFSVVNPEDHFWHENNFKYGIYHCAATSAGSEESPRWVLTSPPRDLFCAYKGVPLIIQASFKKSSEEELNGKLEFDLIEKKITVYHRPDKDDYETILDICKPFFPAKSEVRFNNDYDVRYFSKNAKRKIKDTNWINVLVTTNLPNGHFPRPNIEFEIKLD